MQIRSTDPTRQRTIDDQDVQTRESARREATPDWDRIPTTTTAAASVAAAGRGEGKELKAKVQRLIEHVRQLKEALGPYSKEVQEMMHGAHELEEAGHMFYAVVEKEVGPLGPEVFALACAKAVHAGYTIAHAYEGMEREAPEAAAKAFPLIHAIMQDIADIKAMFTPAIERPPAMIRG